MFCQNCGKQLADNAKFCSGCGQPVEREETVPGSEGPVVQPERGPEQVPFPDQEQGEVPAGPDSSQTGSDGAQTAPEAAAAPILSGTKHRGKAAIGLLIGAAVVVVLLVVAAVNLFSSLGKSEELYLYAQQDGELMYLADLKQDSETMQLTDKVGGTVWISPDGKYVYFFEGADQDYSSYADLYCIEAANLGKDGQRPQRVSSKVNTYQYTTLENGGIVFMKESGSGEDLYCYDGEHDFKLADEVYSYTLDETEKTAYYTQQDETDSTFTIFRMPLQEDAEAEELLTGAASIYSEMDAEVLLYGEGEAGQDEWSEMPVYDVYSKKPGETEQLLVEDAWSVNNVKVGGGELSFTYLTTQTTEHTLYDFVLDSSAATDATAQEPKYEDFFTGEDEWGWKKYDTEAYYLAQEAWSQVERRNYIREQLKSTPYEVTSYTLHRYENGIDTVLAEGLDDIPTWGGDSGIYIYQKHSLEVSPVVELAQLYYYDDVYDYIYEEEAVTYQNVNGVESELELEEGSNVWSIYPAGEGHVALMIGGETSEIVSCTVENNALVLGDVLGSDDFSICYTGSQDALYYFADVSGDYSYGNLTLYQDGKTTVLAKDAGAVFQLEDGTIFKLEDRNLENGEGSLYQVKDEKEVRIDDDVSDVVFLPNARMLYISDGDLYLWEKEESVRLARDVTGIWASDSLYYDSYYL